MPDVLARGVRFHVQEIGSGDPLVVMVHGLVIDTLASWYTMAAAALRPYASVLLYDLRGHGLSERTPSGYALADSVLDLEAILHEVGAAGRPTIVAGNSYGGRIALGLAARAPELVDGVVVVDTEISRPARLIETLERLREIEELPFSQRMAAGRALWEDWLDSSREENGELGADVTHALKLARTRMFQRRRPAGQRVRDLLHSTSFVDELAADPGLDEAELASIACPVVGVYGERSGTRGNGERLAQVVPRCTLEIVPGAAHVLLMMQPEAVREVLRREILRQAPVS
jgi:pimeloyl-ACP methyl ester carboxylesterase